MLGWITRTLRDAVIQGVGDGLAAVGLLMPSETTDPDKIAEALRGRIKGPPVLHYDHELGQSEPEAADAPHSNGKAPPSRLKPKAAKS